MKSLEAEVGAMESLRQALLTDVLELRRERDKALVARSAWGHVQNALGYALSLYCIYRWAAYACLYVCARVCWWVSGWASRCAGLVSRHLVSLHRCSVARVPPTWQELDGAVPALQPPYSTHPPLPLPTACLPASRRWPLGRTPAATLCHARWACCSVPSQAATSRSTCR